LLSSPACWAAYGEVSSRAYLDPQRLEVLQVQIDAYAVQHPGGHERRAAQSVGIHLMTLCLVFERGADPREGPRLHRLMVERPVFHWLEPPRTRGTVTVLDVLATSNGDSHIAKVSPAAPPDVHATPGSGWSSPPTSSPSPPWAGIANSVIYYGKGGEIASNRRDEQEMTVLCLRILQAALVYVNTLILQDVLAEDDWAELLTPEDRRGLTPLFWQHVLPYGEVKLDMTARLSIRTTAPASGP